MHPMTKKLTTQETEALRRVSMDGAARACIALSQMTGMDLYLTVDQVEVLPLQAVADLLGGGESKVVALLLRIYGDSRGSILIALQPDAAARLAAAILGREAYPSDDAHPIEQMTELEQSGLLEMANILASCYLNALGGVTRRSLIPSVPALAVDMAGAIVDDLLEEAGACGDSALVITTVLSAPEGMQGAVRGHILLLPDPLTLPDVLGALGPHAMISGS